MFSVEERPFCAFRLYPTMWRIRYWDPWLSPEETDLWSAVEHCAKIKARSLTVTLARHRCLMEEAIHSGAAVNAGTHSSGEVSFQFWSQLFRYYLRGLCKCVPFAVLVNVIMYKMPEIKLVSNLRDFGSYADACERWRRLGEWFASPPHFSKYMYFLLQKLAWILKYKIFE